MEKETHLIVKKHNNLINARYDLSPLEQKLVCYCATTIKTEDDAFKEFTITSKEFFGFSGTNFNRYSELALILDRLYEKSIYIKNSEKEGDYTKLRWIQKAQYVKSKGKVTFRFSDDISDFLLKLGTHFTTYDIKNIMDFKNKHSLRFYELLVQYKNMNKKLYTRTFDLDKLKGMLMLENKYPKWYPFKINVLEPVLKDLAFTNIKNIRYEPQKIGKKIVGIKFYYEICKKDEEKWNDIVKRDEEALKGLKEKVDFKDLTFNATQLLELENKAKEQGEYKNIDAYLLLNMSIAMLYARMENKELEPIENKFNYLMKML